MPMQAKDLYNSFANRSAYLQRAHLTPAQKANKGMNAGATGVNTGKFDSAGAGTKQLNVMPGTGAGAAAAATAGTSGLDFKAIQKAIQEGIGYDPATGLSNLSPKINKNGSIAETTTAGTTNGGKTNAGTTNAGTTTSGTPAAGFTFSGDYAADAQKLMTQLLQINSTPFKYDQNTDPNYAAAKQSLEQGASTAKNKTMAEMNDRGIFNSSITANQMGNIEQQTVQSLAQIVPGLEANAYNRHMQGINSQTDVLKTMLGQANYQQGFEADQRWNEADVTGTYESPEIQRLMKSVTDAKQGWAGTTDPAERLNFQKNADSARAALAQLTGRTAKEVDAMFGAKVGLNKAIGNFGMGGIETMGAKGMRLEGERYDAGVKYQEGRDKVADAQMREENDQAWAQINKPSGGGSSSGLSFNELVKGNTNGLINQMLSEVKDEAGAKAWIQANLSELQLANVNPTDLLGAATDFFKTGGNGGLTPVEVHKMAMAEAQKDPAWMDATTPEERDAAYQKIYNKISSLNSPKKTIDPVSALYSIFQRWTGGGNSGN